MCGAHFRKHSSWLRRRDERVVILQNTDRAQFSLGMELTHLFTFFQGLGGVQSVLRRHHDRDEHHGIKSRFVLFFERRSVSSTRVEGLGLNFTSTVSLLRRRFRHTVQSEGLNVAIYHNLWGLPLCFDMDRALCRIGVLHSHWPGMNWQLSMQRGLLDGVLCVATSLQKVAQEAFPELDEKRIGMLPYPVQVFGPTHEDRRSATADAPVVLGYSGRLVREQKRVDRLPKLIQLLESHRLNYRFEFLGDGPQRKVLERCLSGNSRIRFHGSLSGDEYWKVLRRWDFIVFVSEFEGLPISMLEAMAVGVVPIYPNIHSGGESYARKVSDGLVYESEKFSEVVLQLERWNALREPDREALRENSRAAVKVHLGDSYEQSFSRQIREIVALPGVSRRDLYSRSRYLSDHCPFALLRRFWPKGMIRGSEN